MTQAQLIDRAIKANFADGDGTIPVWKEILRIVLYHSFGIPQEDYDFMHVRHNRILSSDDRYRVKTGLVRNYIELMK